MQLCAGVTRHVSAVLTVSLGADEAGGGAVEEGEEAGHGQADVRVSGPQVQSGEPGEVNLQDVLRSHLHIGHLHGDTEISLFVAGGAEFALSFKHFIPFIFILVVGTDLSYTAVIYFCQSFVLLF